MKPIPKILFSKDSIAKKLCLEAKEAYERINESCNNFLKTQQGIQYLIMKYPKLSLEQAILEYYNTVMIKNYEKV